MNYIQSMQSAINYMEQHILENINYEDVARQVYMSNYHFHRTFSMLTGITANEYIKNRRLSMAGHELVMSSSKIIDIAYKYGYESPESFTKAFTRFHGVTPTAAKHAGAQLRQYNRLIIKIIIEGGNIMDYRIVEKEGFKLLLKVREFNNQSISEEGNNDIPMFWNECIKSGALKELREITGCSDCCGACGEIDEKSDYFKYGVGREYKGQEVPAGYELWEVKPRLWAVFRCIGKDGACIAAMWERILKEFLPGSEYERMDDIDLEVYSDSFEEDVFCEIWIPVKKATK